MMEKARFMPNNFILYVSEGISYFFIQLVQFITAVIKKKKQNTW